MGYVILWHSLSLPYNYSKSPTRPDTNRAVQSYKIARGLNFGFRKTRGCTVYKAKTKDDDQPRATDLRLCFLIYANSRISHDTVRTY